MSYDDWKTTPPEDDREIVGMCKCCHYEVFEGDFVRRLGDDIFLHEECVEKMKNTELIKFMLKYDEEDFNMGNDEILDGFGTILEVA